SSERRSPPVGRATATRERRTPAPEAPGAPREGYSCPSPPFLSFSLYSPERRQERGMRLRNMLGVAVAVVLSAGARDALAHHSFAPHFDASKPVSISGTVTQFEARNPHSYLHLAAVDENGRTR